MKAILIAVLALAWVPAGVYAGDNDAPVTPEVVQGQPASHSSEVDQAGERLPGNQRPGPATAALEKAKRASTRAWESTKEGASEAADYTSEKAVRAWQATKEGTGKAVDWTKDKSEQAWEATKKTAGEAGDAIKSGFDKAKQKTTDILNRD